MRVARERGRCGAGEGEGSRAGTGSECRPRLGAHRVPCTQHCFQDQGWGATLANRLVRKCDVVNRGFSGYNTRWAKLILPRLISKSAGAESTVAVTIFFGANDSALKDLNPKQHVPLEEYAANLKSMVQYLKSVDITEDRIILITPPPLQESAWEKECLAKGDKLNRRNSVTGEYAKACVQVARDCGTAVVDLWTLMQKNQVRRPERCSGTARCLILHGGTSAAALITIQNTPKWPFGEGGENPECFIWHMEKNLNTA
uniref:Isoamyl acetate-hydrolyzing esterase 1 homolog n=1 Tax=Nothoprocta perdicaria TaxID=30464 RepID=A0A8C6ZPT5_NOTPE